MMRQKRAQSRDVVRGGHVVVIEERDERAARRAGGGAAREHLTGLRFMQQPTARLQSSLEAGADHGGRVVRTRVIDHDDFPARGGVRLRGERGEDFADAIRAIVRADAHGDVEFDGRGVMHERGPPVATARRESRGASPIGHRA